MPIHGKSLQPSHKGFRIKINEINKCEGNNLTRMQLWFASRLSCGFSVRKMFMFNLPPNWRWQLPEDCKDPMRILE